MSFDRRISLITLGVADVQASAAFYERLGWTRSSASQEQIVFIKLKGLALGLFSREELAKDAHLPEAGQVGFSGVTLAHNLESPEAVDAAMALAVAAGARQVKAPEKVFWGGYSGYFADPDGHLWELAHNPFAPLDEAGHMILPD
ncbi:VOC family protein [Pseudomonas sp. CNPSo 3701]|uniref:VOC family protein n=1 Tax=Pseudomonas sp. CNPSo 3701 TaxID=3027943 RepID=UPI00236392DE|nr:VOC family protein [Pseudomonas sp. CNPSo 3701]MDD1510169.1 VOC family protein [Pseudomonas sp. CNPSo 3701]